MTTRVHIVNFGPQAVSVRPAPTKAVGSILYAQQSTDVYVYGEQTVTVEEVSDGEQKPAFDAGGPPNVRE